MTASRPGADRSPCCNTVRLNGAGAWATTAASIPTSMTVVAKDFDRFMTLLTGGPEGPHDIGADLKVRTTFQRQVNPRRRRFSATNLNSAASSRQRARTSL